MWSSISWPSEAAEFLRIDLDAELREHVGLQAGEIECAGMRALRAAHVDEGGDDAFDDLGNPFLLILAFQQLAAHAVDRLALLVHHVVVFEQVLAGGEVLRLHGLLRGGDALGDELATRSARLPPCRAAA